MSETNDQRIYDRCIIRVGQLEAENEKLRELVWDMWDFYCVMPDEPHVFKEELDFSVEVWKRMRELGWKWADD